MAEYEFGEIEKVVGDHVQPYDLPDATTYMALKSWVAWGEGTDDQGRFLGWCPLHEDEPGGPHSALYGFNKRMMWCQGEPSCHAPKRAVSLQNLYIRLVTQYLNDE